MDKSRLEQLEALATPAPWVYWITRGGLAVVSFDGNDVVNATRITEFSRKQPRAQADAELIVAARNAVPELLKEIYRLQAVTQALLEKTY